MNTAAFDEAGDGAERPAEGDLAEGDLAEGDLAEGDLAEGDLAEGDLAEGDLAEGYVKPPRPMPWPLGALLSLVERRLGKRLVANRILAWYPKALLGSGIMEALVAHDEAEVPKRLLKLVRIYVSFLASCPFCIDMNAKEYREGGISDEEILALRGLKRLEDVGSISESERAALDYVRCATLTPVSFTPEVIERLHAHFHERGIVIIASTCAQVNFWTRLIQSLGVQPAGFSSGCSILDLDRYKTMHSPGSGG